MKALKGNLVFFEMSEVQSTKAELERLGFGAYVPRNDYKTALIKALKEYKKTEDEDKIYRRFLDEKDGVSFTIFAERIELEQLSLDREITLKLDKVTGVVTCDCDSSALLEEFHKIREMYTKHQGTIDATQLRQLIVKAIRNDAHGISMRRAGGIYFVDDRFTPALKNVVELLSSFRHSASIKQIPIYGDQNTIDAIATASEEDIFNNIEELIEQTQKAFEKGDMTERKLEGRKSDALAIVEKVKIHRDNLASKLGNVTTRLNQVMAALEEVTVKVSSGLADSNDFMNLLAKL